MAPKKTTGSGKGTPAQKGKRGKRVAKVDKQHKKKQSSYPLRVHKNGLLSRLPEDFEFPQAGTCDLWLRWNVGDDERGIPPLSVLRHHDYSFLDKKEKSTMMNRGSTGKQKRNAGHLPRPTAT